MRPITVTLLGVIFEFKKICHWFGLGLKILKKEQVVIKNTHITQREIEKSGRNAQLATTIAIKVIIIIITRQKENRT